MISLWMCRRVAFGAVAGLLTTSLMGCSPGRSVESFCSTYSEEKQAYVEKYDKASGAIKSAGEQDPLAGLLGGTAMVAQSLGDTIIIFDKLDKVAPDDIQPDVAAIRDSLKSQMESVSEMASNPLGALVGGLFQGLASGGSWQRVSDYLVVNCGVPAGSAQGDNADSSGEVVAQSSPSPTSPESPTPIQSAVYRSGAVVVVDETLLCEGGGGLEPKVAGDNLVGLCGNTFVGVDLATATSTLNVTIPEQEMVVSWGTGGGVVAAVTHEDVPQLGTKPAHTVVRARAYDAEADTSLWTRELTVPETDDAEFRSQYVDDLEIIGVSPQGVVLVDSTVYYACGARIPDAAIAVAPDGSIAWSTERIWAVNEGFANTGTGNYRSDCGSDEDYVDRIVEASTGSTLFQGGSYELRDANVACSPWIRSRKHEYSSDPPDQFTNLRTGELITTEGDFEAVVSDGVLVRGEDDSLIYIDSAGRELWQLPSEVTQNVSVVNGQLLVTDGVDETYVIDQSTGETLQTVQLPTGLSSDGLWQQADTESGRGWEPADAVWACS
ncbi:MAG: hypothetical protein ACOYEV_08575 [Candidatus Nanopelagicales bacterium]